MMRLQIQMAHYRLAHLQIDALKQCADHGHVLRPNNNRKRSVTLGKSISNGDQRTLRLFFLKKKYAAILCQPTHLEQASEIGSLPPCPLLILNAEVARI
jgi:hypothetical protein